MNRVSNRIGTSLRLPWLAIAAAVAIALFPSAASADVLTEKWAREWPLSQISAPAYYSPDVKRIAVMPFTVSGDDKTLSESLMNRLTAAITQEGFLETVGRSDLEKVLGEQRFQQSGFADPATAKELGKLLGVDAIIAGSASDVSSESQNHEEEVVDYYKDEQHQKTVFNKDTGKNEIKYYTEKVPVYKKVLVVEQWSHASLEAKMIDIETGSILCASAASGDYSNKNFAGEGKTYSDSEMVDWAVSDAVGSLMKDFTPHKETFISYLFCYPAGFINQDYAAGWALALGGDYPGALALFRISDRPAQVKHLRAFPIAWNECLMFAAMADYAGFDGSLANFRTKFADVLATEPGLAAHASELAAFLGRSFKLRYEGAMPEEAMQIAAVDGEDYYVALPAGVTLAAGQKLAAVAVRNIVNELTGAVITSKEEEIAHFEVIEAGSGFARCKLLDGACKVGDRVRVV